jgi:hypothetical protein
LTALSFTVTGAPLAAKRTRILPLIQHADKIWNEGKSYLYSHITGGVENIFPVNINIFRN